MKQMFQSIHQELLLLQCMDKEKQEGKSQSY